MFRAKRRFHCIAEKIDEQLLELIGISQHADRRSRLKFDRKASFKMYNLFEQQVQREQLKLRCRQPGELLIGLQKAIERRGARHRAL